jgi:hypothetical protein
VQFEDLHRANRAKIARAAQRTVSEPPTPGYRPPSLFDLASGGDLR